MCGCFGRLTWQQGSRVAEVAGHDCYGGVFGICAWEGAWRDSLQGEEDYVCVDELWRGARSEERGRGRWVAAVTYAR